MLLHACFNAWARLGRPQLQTCRAVQTEPAVERAVQTQTEPVILNRKVRHAGTDPKEEWVD